MKALKNLKSFDLFFESLLFGGSSLNESATPEEKDMFLNSQEYQKFISTGSTEDLVNLIIKAMEIAPGKIHIGLQKDNEKGNVFIPTFIRELESIKKMDLFYTILYEQIIAEFENDEYQTIESMARASANTKGQAFSQFSDWLLSKGDEMGEGVAAIWSEKESEAYGTM